MSERPVFCEAPGLRVLRDESGLLVARLILRESPGWKLTAWVFLLGGLIHMLVGLGIVAFVIFSPLLAVKWAGAGPPPIWALPIVFGPYLAMAVCAFLGGLEMSSFEQQVTVRPNEVVWERRSKLGARLVKLTGPGIRLRHKSRFGWGRPEWLVFSDLGGNVARLRIWFPELVWRRLMAKMAAILGPESVGSVGSEKEPNHA
jgi:hypothetical protein